MTVSVPFKLEALSQQLSQWCYSSRQVWNESFDVVQLADKTLQLFQGSRKTQLADSFDFSRINLNVMLVYKKTQELIGSHSKGTFAWIKA